MPQMLSITFLLEDKDSQELLQQGAVLSTESEEYKEILSFELSDWMRNSNVTISDELNEKLSENTNPYVQRGLLAEEFVVLEPS